jgi:indolepyruvate ferredoxin oxidoreductase beta subunit
MRNFKAIMSLLDGLPAADAASKVKALREAALADEGGAALQALMRSMGPCSPAPGFEPVPAHSIA